MIVQDWYIPYQMFLSGEMNYTFLPPGHPSSDVLRIRADQHIVVASVYANDGMTRNLLLQQLSFN